MEVLYLKEILANHWPTGVAVLVLWMLQKHAVSRIDALEATLNNGIRATL